MLFLSRAFKPLPDHLITRLLAPRGGEVEDLSAILGRGCEIIPLHFARERGGPRILERVTEGKCGGPGKQPAGRLCVLQMRLPIRDNGRLITALLRLRRLLRTVWRNQSSSFLPSRVLY